MTNDTSNFDFSFVLASGVHDMKNSLSMLLNTLGDVMEKYPPQSEAHAKSYAILEYEAARINNELIQLLSLYRLDQDSMHVHIDEHLVIDVLQEQVSRNHGLLQSKNIQLAVDCDESLRGYFDSDLIGGVINNVLVNCARYCDHQLTIAASQTAEGLCLSIDDDGPGYPEDMRDASRHLDTRVSFASGRPHLGLFFAHKVAEMHQNTLNNNRVQKGFIRLTNGGTLGGGRFAIYLP